MWHKLSFLIEPFESEELYTILVKSAGREITAGQRTMSGQNAELSGQILTLPVILTAHFR
jgi:hypothetical protein